uniref:Uncharacterized protein n=1 Tax=Arundo donax TaxID=35708 RepID=A0A0A8XNI8_ARUDO
MHRILHARECYG